MLTGVLATDGPVTEAFAALGLPRQRAEEADHRRDRRLPGPQGRLTRGFHLPGPLLGGQSPKYLDLAVGVIIGAAFGAIVASLVGDIIMPLVGAATGGFDFSNHFLALSSKVTQRPWTRQKSKAP